MIESSSCSWFFCHIAVSRNFKTARRRFKTIVARLSESFHHDVYDSESRGTFVKSVLKLLLVFHQNTRVAKVMVSRFAYQSVIQMVEVTERIAIVSEFREVESELDSSSQ